MFDLKSYIIGMVCMGLLTLFDRSIISYLKKFKKYKSSKQRKDFTDSYEDSKKG